MFGVDSSEFLVVAVVALLVVGPKDLPKLLRTVGGWVGRARGMARHFRSGIDAMIRESELEEMDRKWREENERIMREHPPEPAMPPLAPTETVTADAQPAGADPGALPSPPPVPEGER